MKYSTDKGGMWIMTYLLVAETSLMMLYSYELDCVLFHALKESSGVFQFKLHFFSLSGFKTSQKSFIYFILLVTRAI